MTGIITKHLVEQQIPSHIREANPLLTKFLEYYYEFQKTAKIPDLIQEIRRYNDIDQVDEEFLLTFFEEFKNLPQSIAADPRLVAKHIYDLYKTKGSEAGLKLLFRIVYGEEIDVTYPSEDILRASDGKWVQNNLVTAVAQFGSLKPTSNKIRLIGSKGTFTFEIKNIETIDGEDRFSFEPNKLYYVEPSQRIEVYTNSTLDYIGNLVEMPSAIEIEDGGAFWQVGQVIVLPGDGKNTICQVKRVGPGGVIKKLEIIEHGILNNGDVSYTVAPFKYKPISSYVETISTKISDDPVVYSHTVNVTDYMNGVVESVLAFNSNQQYVLEGYVLKEYIARRLFGMTSYQDATNSDIANDEITIDQWVQSRARIKLMVGYNAKQSGYYESVQGHLSSSTIRLQDNFFYQLFSYVVQTSRKISEFKNVISLVHPAGMKYFGTQTKTNDVQVTVDTSRVLSYEIMMIEDHVTATETIVKGIARTFNDIAKPQSRNPYGYDGNNELEYYDPGVQYDDTNGNQYDAEAYDVSYGAEAAYDARDYDVIEEFQFLTSDGNIFVSSDANVLFTENEQYTLEDENIQITKN